MASKTLKALLKAKEFIAAPGVMSPIQFPNEEGQGFPGFLGGGFPAQCHGWSLR